MNRRDFFKLSLTAGAAALLLPDVELLLPSTKIESNVITLSDGWRLTLCLEPASYLEDVYLGKSYPVADLLEQIYPFYLLEIDAFKNPVFTFAWCHECMEQNKSIPIILNRDNTKMYGEFDLWKFTYSSYVGESAVDVKFVSKDVTLLI